MAVDDCPGAILARRRAHTALASLFPGWRLFVPGEPRMGYRFNRVIVFLTFESPSECQIAAETGWVMEFSTALPPGIDLEWIRP
jgi:hypothetical protein